MNCEDRNQDLLLLAHGELGGIRKALVEQHLRRCARCQERRQRYGVLSSVIAGEIRPRQMAPWAPHAASPDSAPLTARRLALCVALAILLAVAATAGAVWSPSSWWGFGPWGKQSQSIDTSCLTNAPGNVPAASNQPTAPPSANRPAPTANVPAAPDACLTHPSPAPSK